MLIILSITSYFFIDHVQKRINTFFDPSADTYQIDLSLKAFKSGGLFGKGPAQRDLKEKIPDAVIPIYVYPNNANIVKVLLGWKEEDVRQAS